MAKDKRGGKLYLPMVINNNQSNNTQQNNNSSNRTQDYIDGLGGRGEPIEATQVLKQANPHYYDYRRDPSIPRYRWGWNCQKCAWTYEMARRGYDVEALPMKDMFDYVGWQTVGHNPDGSAAEIISNLGSRNVPDKLGDVVRGWGDGARGIISVMWKGGNSGHVFNVENVNGTPVFVDAQDGSRVDINYYMDNAIKKYTKIMRTDNLVVGDKIKRCCKERGT